MKNVKKQEHKNVGKSGVALAVLALLALGTVLPAGIGKTVNKAVFEVKHAAGWDAAGVKTVDADKAGRPTLEASSNSSVKVERQTSYHDGGGKDSQTVKVTAKDSGKVLYQGKKDWNENGKLTYAYEEDATFAADGSQEKGWIKEQKFDDNGRLTKEIKKKYKEAEKSWDNVYEQELEYYENGDLKTRVTDDKDGDGKVRESWGAKKGMTGRKKTTVKE